MYWLKTLALFIGLVCNSNAFGVSLCQSQPIYTPAEATYFSLILKNEISSPPVVYTSLTGNTVITSQNLAAPDATTHHQQTRNNKYRLGRKRWKNANFRTSAPITTAGIRHFFITRQPNREPYPNSNQPYSTHLPDALVISIHKLSNVIEPLK